MEQKTIKEFAIELAVEIIATFAAVQENYFIKETNRATLRSKRGIKWST